MKQNLINSFKQFGKGVHKQSPLLLTVGAVVGIGGIIFTTVKATSKTKDDIKTLEHEAYSYKDGTVDKKEKAKVIVKNYWPVAVVTGGTVAMIIGNHRINTSRLQTATVAYEFYKDAYSTYRKKVRERLGDDVDRETQVEVAKERHKNEFSNIDPALIPGNGVIFIESLTGQVFRASVEDIMKECRRFNEDLRGSDWLCLNEWLCHLGLQQTSYKIGDNLGFGERYDHDGLNIILTPSNTVFPTGETATLIDYEDELISWNDYECINA